MSELAVAFVVREKFSVAHESLMSVLAAVPAEAAIFVVDTGYPAGVRADIADLLQQHPANTILPSEEYILPNAAFNRVVEVIESPHLLVVENDVLLEEETVTRLVGTAKEWEADIVSPLILQGRGRALHYDPPISTIAWEGEQLRSEVERIPRNGHGRVRGTRVVQHIEKHAFLVSRRGYEQLYPLEESLNTREQIDFSLKAFSRGLATVFDDQAVARYIAPPPLEPIDLEFFQWRWDEQAARASNEYVEKTWKLVDFVPSLGFVRRMNSLLPK